MLPAAAAAGVLVGNDGGAAPDKALVAALKQQGARAAQPVAAATPAAAAAVADTAASGPVTSDFTAARGFVVRLKALPGGTDAAAVAAAKKAAKRHGATKVGVLVTKDFTLKPAVKAPFMVYSGPYPSRTAADAARSKLGKAYPGAQVVAVKTPSSGGVHAARAAKIAAEDAVVRKHPTQQQETQGGQIVKQIQAKQGKSYVEQQQQLPDTIVVP
jgi:hypothetical protein